MSEKFKKLGVDTAPGQETMQKQETLPAKGEIIPGTPVDFSHGDVDAFTPIPGTLGTFIKGVEIGGKQAYTEYRGKAELRKDLAEKLANFSGAPVNAESEIILTPGTQGALFLAMGAIVGRGDKVAIIEPDYFANRKLVEFFDGELMPVQIHYNDVEHYSGLDFAELEAAFKGGASAFLFSNPNNPTGVIYSPDEVAAIGRLAKQYDVTVIADELYSRQIFSDTLPYTHLRALPERPEKLITIIGPSKTESLSGYRLGVAYGSADIITRMEKLQAIVSLRAGGYSQAVFKDWFAEPEGWMSERVQQHEAIRDDLLFIFRACPGCSVRATEAGSYVFVTIPELEVTLLQFIKLLRAQAAVTVTPGIEFGPQFTTSFRMNFSQDHKAAVAAAHRIVTMIERYRA
ncbi:MAG TPA: pyridoxal phosphate-dependent aminotransferase [Clostridia bacterium]|nr:pyridoxal phosphate-dependent aminotransferase [Clostridia bacterium]